MYIVNPYLSIYLSYIYYIYTSSYEDEVVSDSVSLFSTRIRGQVIGFIRYIAVTLEIERAREREKERESFTSC